MDGDWPYWQQKHFKSCWNWKHQNEEQVVLVGMNLESKFLGKRNNKDWREDYWSKEVNKIALIAPNATVNIIKDYEVVKNSRWLFQRLLRILLNALILIV